MATFPTLSTGSPAKYPFTRGRRQRSTTLVFNDFSEQHFAMGSVLDDIKLVFNDISTADKETIRAFWNSSHGAYDTTWSVMVTDTDGSTRTFSNMQFTPGQQFSATNIKPGRWSVTLVARQTR